MYIYQIIPLRGTGKKARVRNPENGVYDTPARRRTPVAPTERRDPMQLCAGRRVREFFGR